MNRLLLAALLVSVSATPVLAQDSTHIAFDRASLVTAKGRLMLQRRVDRAASRICGDQRKIGSILSNPAVRACRVAALAAARPQVEQAIAQANRPAVVAHR